MSNCSNDDFEYSGKLEKTSVEFFISKYTFKILHLYLLKNKTSPTLPPYYSYKLVPVSSTSHF